MLSAIRRWLKTDFVAVLRIFVWCAAVGAGFGVGWLARSWYCEVEFLQKADRFYAEARELTQRFDNAKQESRDQWYAFLETGCGGH